MCSIYKNTENLVTATFFILYVLHGLRVFLIEYRASWYAYKVDLMQPWKLVTLALGTAWLLWGALTLHIDDWDVGVSLIMAGLTYICAPWCARAVIGRRWSLLAGVTVTCWFCVDGSYNLWHHLVGNVTYRDANFPASMSLFWLCAFIWVPMGSVRDIIFQPKSVRFTLGSSR